METEGEENAKKSEIKRNQGLIKIKFPSEEHARMVMISLQVDEELQPMKIERNISVDTNYLIITFKTTNTKLMRVAISSILDMVTTYSRTIVEFDDELLPRN